MRGGQQETRLGIVLKPRVNAAVHPIQPAPMDERSARDESTG